MRENLFQEPQLLGDQPVLHQHNRLWLNSSPPLQHGNFCLRTGPTTCRVGVCFAAIAAGIHLGERPTKLSSYPGLRFAWRSHSLDAMRRTWIVLGGGHHSCSSKAFELSALNFASVAERRKFASVCCKKSAMHARSCTTGNCVDSCTYFMCKHDMCDMHLSCILVSHNSSLAEQPIRCAPPLPSGSRISGPWVLPGF